MLKTIAVLILAFMVFAVEQVVGLPFLFFAVIIWISQALSPISRQAILAGAGLLISLTFHLPLAGGWLLLVGLALLAQASQAWVKNDAFRFLLISAVGGGVVAVASQFEWTTATTISVLISIIVTYIFSQAIFLLSLTTDKLKLTPSVRLVKSEKL